MPNSSDVVCFYKYFLLTFLLNLQGCEFGTVRKSDVRGAKASSSIWLGCLSHRYYPGVWPGSCWLYNTGNRKINEISRTLIF